MNFKKNLFSAIIVLAFVSPNFATPSNYDEGSTNSKALTEIKSIIQHIDFNFESSEVESVKVHFMVNTANEVVVLRTNSKDFDQVIKSNLNYKSLENKDLEVNKVYILPITFQS